MKTHLPPAAHEPGATATTLREAYNYTSVRLTHITQGGECTLGFIEVIVNLPFEISKCCPIMGRPIT